MWDRGSPKAYIPGSSTLMFGSWQWHSHWGVKGGQSASPDSEKIAKNLEGGKIGGKKKRKNREEKQKSGRFFHFAPPDR